MALFAKLTETVIQRWGDSKGKIIVTVILVATGIYLWNDYRDAKRTMEIQASKISTLSEDFHKLGEAYVGQGELFKNDRAAFQAALAAQGESLVKEMKAKDARIAALYEGQGVILEELRRHRPPVGPVDPGPDGSFKDARMLQGRSSFPLTEVTLSYDPKNPDPTKRLLGDWRNYKETFNYSVAEWKKGDGGITGTFRLWREVRRGDEVVGKEEIPLEKATTTINPIAFRNMGVAVPRWTIQAGAAWDWQKKQWGPAIIGDYRLTGHWGFGGGVAGNQVLMLTSFRFGGK